jgi:RNA polymerase sigma factor (sigma-70 family)
VEICAFREPQLPALDPYSTTFARRDGVDFDRMQGVKSARCLCIVNDERRGSRSKAARPCGVARRSPLDVVACLRVVETTRPRRAPRQRTAPGDHGVQMWSNKGLAITMLDTPGWERRHEAVNLGEYGYDNVHGKPVAYRNMTTTGGLTNVFMANRPALTSYVRARFRMDGDAEDIIQDLWLKLATLETGPVAEPLAYLYRMTENFVLDRRRSAIRRGNREREWTKGQIDGTLDHPVDSQPDAERILLARDHLRRVDAVLDNLPERTAFAFRAVRIEGTPQKEIAAQMGISLSAVEKHLQRAYHAVIDVQQKLDAENELPDRLGFEGSNHVG